MDAVEKVRGARTSFRRCTTDNQRFTRECTKLVNVQPGSHGYYATEHLDPGESRSFQAYSAGTTLHTNQGAGFSRIHVQFVDTQTSGM